jgi:hypothetical protein
MRLLSIINDTHMPVVRIDFDNEKLSNDEAASLSQAVQKIVIETTKIDDVFVYANSPQLKINIAPVEVFVEMSAHIIADQDALIADIKTKLLAWKQEQHFPHLINLTLIPMNWKIEIGI